MSYPNLVTRPNSKSWYFRKYSSAKAAEFNSTTGIPAEKKNAAAAYRVGLEKFNAWVGLSARRVQRIRELGEAMALEKKSASFALDTYRSFESQVRLNINPVFGHLRPDQITMSVLTNWASGVHKEGRKAAGTWKVLREILNRARSLGMLREVPKFIPKDAEPAKPRFVTPAQFARIVAALEGQTKLMAFIMYYQGARPREVLRYRWDDIDWTALTLTIRPETTKTRRGRTIPMAPEVVKELRRLKPKARSVWIFPSHMIEGEYQVGYWVAWAKAMRHTGMDFIPYNLRDTFITRALKRGVSSTFIGKYVDNSGPTIERHYAVAEVDVMRQVAGWDSDKIRRG